MTDSRPADRPLTPDPQDDHVVRDSVIYGEVIHPWEDAHPEPGPDEDTLRAAYFAGRLHADWPGRTGWLAGYGGLIAAVLAGAAVAPVGRLGGDPVTPRRIQRRRTAGWRMPEGAVYVGRPTVWGNPFIVGQSIGCDDVPTAVALHRGWLEQGFTAPYPLPGETAHLEQLRELVLSRASELTGRDLVCWCATGQPCHADVLLGLGSAAPELAAMDVAGADVTPDPAAPATTTT